MVKKSPECTAGGYGQCDTERTQVRAEAFPSREKRAVAAVACISVLLGAWLSKNVLESRTFQTRFRKYPELDSVIAFWGRIQGSYHGFESWIRIMGSYHAFGSGVRIQGSYQDSHQDSYLDSYPGFV